MRVAAIGDAHLGRAALNVLTAEGVNQREADFEVSFLAAVDLALAQAPGLVIWLGDVFDHPRPTYRSFRVAQQALATIRAHGAGLVAISGNHDTPRLPGTASPYAALADTFPEFRFACAMAYERIELPGLVVHAVPQMLTTDQALDALDQADRQRSADRSNVLITHPRLSQLAPPYPDVNELEVDAERLRADLVVLGHYHVHQQVRGRRMWYAGSTDTFSFADDPHRPKGIVVLDSDSGHIRHLPLPGQRPLATLADLDATGLSPAEIEGELCRRAEAAPGGSVARVSVAGVETAAYRLVDLDAVRAAGTALHLRVEPTFNGAPPPVALADVASLGARWDRFVADHPSANLDPERIRRAGHDHLARAIEPG
ncbi:MAG: metallophosphoesterase family protein [Acidimicrobiales bacterium]